MAFTKLEVKYFKKYTQLIGVSGNEKEIAKEFIKDIADLGYEIQKDNLGSLIVIKKSKNPNLKVMVEAHMDEVGFVVKNISSKGLFFVNSIGGNNLKNVVNNRVVLVNKDGKRFFGTCYSKNSDIKDTNDLVFDFGFSSLEEVKNENISVGDMIVLEGEFYLLNNGKRAISKSFDNRYGVVLALETLFYLKDVELDYDLYIALSVQEEVGCRGAEVIANRINPDLAIVLDCSTANGYLGGDYCIGNGLAIRYFDRGMIGNKHLLDFQMSCAKKEKAKYQMFSAEGTTNASRVHKSKSGIPTLNHCIIARGIHTPSTIIDSDDYHSAKKTLFRMLKELKKFL